MALVGGFVLAQYSNLIDYRFLEPNATWINLRKYIDQVGDVYWLVAHNRISLSSSNAEANTQITTRRLDFTKPIENYGIMNIFGANVLTTNGGNWSRQKKIVAPGFSERSNLLAWEGSISQVQAMLASWAKHDGNTVDEIKISDTAEDTVAIALHVICGAGFGVPQIWPGQDEAVLGNMVVPGINSNLLNKDHKWSFVDSLKEVASLRMIWLSLLPVWLLKKSPFKLHNNLMEAYDECGGYFQELILYRKKQAEEDELNGKKIPLDLMGTLIKGSAPAEMGEKDSKKRGTLTESDVVGNCFIFIFADIESIADSWPASEWTYAADMRDFYNSMVGAVFNETLRLVPPVINIPRATRSTAQPLDLDGKQATIPAETFMHIDVVATSRNPRYFPYAPSKVSDTADDLDDFVPERWLLASNDTVGKQKSSGTSENYGIETVSFERLGSLIKPERGAFIAFSDGPHSCPGRRFAQIEVTAVLAVIFNSYSVELDVSRWASDAEVRKMSTEQKRKAYAKAVARTERLIRESESMLTLKMERESSSEVCDEGKRALSRFKTLISLFVQMSNIRLSGVHKVD